MRKDIQALPGERGSRTQGRNTEPKLGMLATAFRRTAGGSAFRLAPMHERIASCPDTCGSLSDGVHTVGPRRDPSNAAALTSSCLGASRVLELGDFWRLKVLAVMRPMRGLRQSEMTEAPHKAGLLFNT